MGCECGCPRTAVLRRSSEKSEYDLPVAGEVNETRFRLNAPLGHRQTSAALYVRLSTHLGPRSCVSWPSGGPRRGVTARRSDASAWLARGRPAATRRPCFHWGRLPVPGDVPSRLSQAGQDRLGLDVPAQVVSARRYLPTGRRRMVPVTSRSLESPVRTRCQTWQRHRARRRSGLRRAGRDVPG